MDGSTDDAQDERVQLAVEGDAEALERLLEAFGPRVRASLSIGRERARDLEADDVMQVTYLEAYLRIRGLRTRTESGFASWLKQIAENNLRDAIRGLEREKRPQAARRITRGANGETARTLLESLASSTTTAGRLASVEEAREVIRSAVAKLPPSYRDVVERYDLEEKSALEVAEERGSSPGAVYMLRSRAHDRLREILGTSSGIFTDTA